MALAEKISDQRGDPLAAIESHRRELTGYCYRMLGSSSEAEDAVQETFVRAWRNVEQLATHQALKAWLYRIATNVCLDMLKSAQRRARPMDFGGPSSIPEVAAGPHLGEFAWVTPIRDADVIPEGDPALVAQARQTVRLAFVAALQHLPPRQRVVLILRDVLRWESSEVAKLLDTTTASVNSALQRARATIDSLDLVAEETSVDAIDDAELEALLERYVEAFERYDIDNLVTLLHEDATFSMPPWKLWLRGRENVHGWMLGPGAGCEGSKVIRLWANGWPAVATYKPSESGDALLPWSIAVLEMRGGEIAGVHNFIYPELFTRFGLPDRL